MQQNITTLRNRVNELGVAEPIIQQQGADRIVVQLARRAGHRARPRTFSAAPPRWKCAWWTRSTATCGDPGGAAGQVPFGAELLHGSRRRRRCW